MTPAELAELEDEVDYCERRLAGYRADVAAGRSRPSEGAEAELQLALDSARARLQAAQG